MPCLLEAVGDAVLRRQGLVPLPIGSLSLGSWVLVYLLLSALWVPPRRAFGS
jgi:hypothetical protein